MKENIRDCVYNIVINNCSFETLGSSSEIKIFPDYEAIGRMIYKLLPLDVLSDSVQSVYLKADFLIYHPQFANPKYRYDRKTKLCEEIDTDCYHL